MGLVLFDEPGEIFIDGTLGGPLDEVDGDVDGEESELFVEIFSLILVTFSSFLGI